MLYTTAGTPRTVVALNPTTGEVLWMHREDEGRARPERGAQRRGPRCRVLVLGPNGADQRIIYVTPGYRMLALDAKTGAPLSTFGHNGVVDLKLEDDQDLDLDHRRHRPERNAAHCRRRDRRRRRAPLQRIAEDDEATRKGTCADSM